MFKKVVMFTSKLVAAASAIREEVFTATNRDLIKAASFHSLREVTHHTVPFIEKFYLHDLDAETRFYSRMVVEGREVSTHVGWEFGKVWQAMEEGENVYVRLHETDDDAIRAFAIYFDGSKQPTFTLNPQLLLRVDRMTFLALFVLREKVSADYSFDAIAEALADAMKGDALPKTGLIPLPGFVEADLRGETFRTHLATVSETEGYSLTHLLSHYDAAHAARRAKPRTARATLKEILFEAHDAVQVKAGGEGFIHYISEVAVLAKLHGYSKAETLGFTQDIFTMIHPVLDPEQQEVFTEQVVRNAIHRAYVPAPTSTSETAKQ